MLPFRVVLKPQHRLDLPAVPPWPSPISFTLIQPLSFQTFTHSFAQRATPIFFSFNRFRTLFSATEGIPPFLPLWNSSLCLSPCPPAPLCPLFSITYELQISQVLSFDIHACNGGCTPSHYPGCDTSPLVSASVRPIAEQALWCNNSQRHGISSRSGETTPLPRCLRIESGHREQFDEVPGPTPTRSGSQVVPGSIVLEKDRSAGWPTARIRQGCW